jgi:hypothetical protein
MKTSLNTLVLGVFLLMFNQGLKGTTVNPDTVVLEIEGKILNSDKDQNLTHVYLLCNNNVIDSFVTKDRKKFKVGLKKNCNYVIRLVKTGYVDKMIAVNTKLTPFNEALYRFSFETTMIELAASAKMNKELLDRPIAMIYFDEKKNCFDYSKTYTMNLKRELALQ